MRRQPFCIAHASSITLQLYIAAVLLRITKLYDTGRNIMSSIVLGMGNGAVMFGDRDASNVPDDDLI